jgi:hypothetical protein
MLIQKSGRILRGRYSNPDARYRADFWPILRFSRRSIEADRIKGSAHPNFIQLFAIERERNISFIVLEWLEGFPLVDLLRPADLTCAKC